MEWIDGLEQISRLVLDERSCSFILQRITIKSRSCFHCQMITAHKSFTSEHEMHRQTKHETIHNMVIQNREKC